MVQIIASRPWNGFADLRGMQQLAVEQRQAVVCCNSEPACALYASLGFRRHSTLVAYHR